MNEPPLLIDGTRVVEYAEFERNAATHRVSVAVNGVQLDLDTVAGVIVSENLVEGGYFLLHCNDRWETVAGAQYPDRSSAREAAERAYAGVPAQWREFRALSKEEEREVEVTREFLQDLAKDYPAQ